MEAKKQFSIHTDKKAPYDTHSKKGVEWGNVMQTYLSFRIREMIEAGEKQSAGLLTLFDISYQCIVVKE